MDNNVVKHFLDRGWQSMQDRTRPHAHAFFAVTQDRSDLNHCECNHKPPGVYLYWYPPSDHNPPGSFELEICGEQEGVWLKLQAYSLRSLDDVKKGLELLRGAWARAT